MARPARAATASTAAARRAARTFRRHDENLLQQTFAHRSDRGKVIALSTQGRRDLAQLLREEAAGAGAQAPPIGRARPSGGARPAADSEPRGG